MDQRFLNEFLNQANEEFLLGYSVGQLAAPLCKGYKAAVDLGLCQDKGWAQQEAMTGTPGPPFAIWSPGRCETRG